MKVIGAGLGRTGTLSLKTALEQLGFGPCQHMTNIAGDAEREGPVWNRIADGAERDWRAVFAGYGSTVDWPGCRYYAELAAAFPDAKVILSLRDAEKWCASMQDTILAPRILGALRDAAPQSPMWFVSEIVFNQTFGDDFSAANVIATFEAHNAAVRRTIAPERLLEFDVAQGWDPLCAFLDVPVAETPFPRSNDHEMFWRSSREFHGAV